MTATTASSSCVVVARARPRARVRFEQPCETRRGRVSGSAERSSDAGRHVSIRRRSSMSVIGRECRGRSSDVRSTASLSWAMPRLRVAAAQINVVVGDLDGNARPHPRRVRGRRGRRAADLVVFPELTITGYPPEDLLLPPGVRRRRPAETLDKIAARTGTLRGGRSGSPSRAATCTTRRRCARTAACTACTASSCCRTTRCSTSSATSRPATDPARCSSSRGVQVGVSICEDAWSPTGPILAQAAGGAELIVNLNASPYYARPARRTRDDARDARRPTRRCRSSTRTSSAARTSSCSTARRSCSTSRAPRRAGAAVRRGPARRRPRRAADVPQAPARSARSAASTPLPEVAVTEARPPTRRRAADRARARAGARGLRGARARHARLRPQERLHRRARSASRAASTRRSSPRSRSTRSAPSTSPAC